MDHTDHVTLLRPGIPDRAGPVAPTWADLGAGTGAFTLALADLLGPGAVIHAVDRDAGPLRQNAEAVATRFPSVHLHTLVADFTAPLGLPPLDGIVMANSLHFARDKAPALAIVRAQLRPGGRLLVVEYDTDRGNPWVPHPFSYERWVPLAAAAGFAETRLLGRVPSRFLGAIYAAASDRPMTRT
jgi:SAM-dependent methyltransferase